VCVCVFVIYEASVSDEPVELIANSVPNKINTIIYLCWRKSENFAGITICCDFL